MYDPGRIFLYSLSALLFSLLYLPVYIRTRRAEDLKDAWKENRAVKLLLCCVFNCLISAVTIAEPRGLPELIFVFVLMLIVDFDLLICRIPTEFLTLLYMSILPGIVTNGNWVYVLISLVLWSFWWIVQRKGLIAVYDVWMILPFTLCLNETKKALLFYALFLILWGSIGLILRYFCGKGPRTKISLVPLMVLSFLVMQLCP